MGTRALINFMVDGDDSETFCTLYHHMDGYPDYLGKKIKETFDSPGDEFFGGKNHNGIECVAAQLVTNLKSNTGMNGIGGLYIYQPGKEDVGEDFVYNLWLEDDVIQMECLGISVNTNDLLYRGDLASFDNEKIIYVDED